MIGTKGFGLEDGTLGKLRLGEKGVEIYFVDGSLDKGIVGELECGGIGDEVG